MERDVAVLRVPFHFYSIVELQTVVLVNTLLSKAIYPGKRYLFKSS